MFQYFTSCLATKPQRPCITFADILANHSGAPKCSMHQDVDAFVRLVFSDVHGNIEGDYVAHHVFEHKDITPADKGHLAVLGYVFQKYCSLDMMPVFKFLLNLEAVYGADYVTYKHDLARYFGVKPKHTSIGIQFKLITRVQCPGCVT